MHLLDEITVLVLKNLNHTIITHMQVEGEIAELPALTDFFHFVTE